jgi:hypothetical protein
LVAFFATHEIFSVTPIKIATSRVSKGGFVNYAHLKNDATKYLREPDTLVTMFVDYFRVPTSLPNYNSCNDRNQLIDDKINCLEKSIAADISNGNFIPYIQKYEFESLLFSNNAGFEALFGSGIYNRTLEIISEFPNPEDINSGADTAPSKRLLQIMKNYDKIADGNLIALEIGIDNILEKCDRFKVWINTLVERMQVP